VKVAARAVEEITSANEAINNTPSPAPRLRDGWKKAVEDEYDIEKNGLTKLEKKIRLRNFLLLFNGRSFSLVKATSVPIPCFKRLSPLNLF
jgi:hypothetical protein